MSENSDITLVLGHAASGKSLWAEAEIARLGGKKSYVATARILDAEMRAKVADHAARRGPEWSLVEAADTLAAVCTRFGTDDTVLIDCATMWLTNRMMDEDDWQSLAEEWLFAMRRSRATFVVVSNDVGGGITPDNAMARRFQRMQGALNQRLATYADRVVLVTAGLPQQLK
ncbi:bifunctional adenosylcobinamide kinase/adenosylcobinamide-phosphate guanylyltransferase [Jannaschia donghaensis]|uniref:Bifunctional adenosylcobalamin biosynthesis protein n=1 Tax=Jannaschia donghaensis TaxID=420998 RepID=A0A0M6YGB9_9RHOB|nr:bifunctional adenosylcobinamide kinase/adenosylcobinamide-phosphate guanylyltransferase [Jannaschia donghaensis]CTQ48126.1 Adenosylcobinamide kinase [Jannaschia donghaensis]